MAENRAVVFINREGRYTEANPPALKLLGVSLEQLLTMMPSEFTKPDAPPPELDSKVEQVEGGQPATGQATLVRPDGREIRISFLLVPEEARYRVEFWPIDVPVDRPMEFHTLADLLTAWRESERHLASHPEGTAEWQRLHDRVAVLRGEYQRLFNARQRRPKTS